VHHVNIGFDYLLYSLLDPDKLREFNISICKRLVQPGLQIGANPHTQRIGKFGGL